MGQILRFTHHQNVFDPDATAAMSEAYDQAIAALHNGAESEPVIRELIAKRILRTAQTGEVDRDRLCRSALSGVNSARFRDG
jgi:hypothetical protein